MKRKNDFLGLTGQMTLWQKIRYSLGNAGDELPYAIFYTYFMMYLTEVVGLSAVVAGIVSAIAAACDGLVDPALGIFSDNLYKKYGTRRPAMIIGLGPLAVVTILLFVPAPVSGMGELIYYAFFSVLFVTFYSLYSMNFVAMGSEITASYDERNFIRLLCGLSAPLFSYLGHGGPQVVQHLLPDMDLEQQWMSTGLSITFIYVVFCVICIFVARSPKEVRKLKSEGKLSEGMSVIEPDEEVKISRLNFIENVVSVLKIKALRAEIVMILSFTIANGFFYALIAYALTHSMGLSAGEQASFWAIESVVYWVAVVACVPLANLFGKKPLFIGCFGIAGVAMTAMYFVGIHSVFGAAILMIAFTLIEAPFWTLYCTWGYEISDIDEFVNEKRRTSLILSVASVFIKVGPTLSFILTGVILNSIGYVEGGVEQAASVAEGLHGYITLLPGLILIVGVIGACFYPVTRKGFDALARALEAKKAGEEYSTEGFEFMLPKVKK